MSFRFDHVGLLTENVDHSLAVYRALGCRVMERSYRRGEYDVAYFGAGTDVLLEFQGPPLLAEDVEYVDRHGWSIERIALVCADVRAEYDALIATGVESAWTPEPFVVDGVTLAIAAGVWSPEGLMIDLVQHVNVAVPRPERDGRDGLSLHHVCCLSPDLDATTRFWTSRFGLTKVYDFTKDNAGFVMLADAHWEPDGHDFFLEIIGGTHDSIDGPVWESRGPCYDHVCFTTADVEGTWQRAVDQGVQPLSEPRRYPEYDATIGWLYDADGNHIELMTPIAPDLVRDVLDTGLCSNHWVDDWQRNPPVFPRPEAGPTILMSP